MSKLPIRHPAIDRAMKFTRVWAKYLEKIDTIDDLEREHGDDQATIYLSQLTDDLERVFESQVVSRDEEQHGKTLFDQHPDFNPENIWPDWERPSRQEETYQNQTYPWVNDNYGKIRRSVRITSADSPYQALFTDHVIFADTDGGVIEVDLPAGVNGREFVVINVGSSANDVNVDPYNTEQVRAGGAGVAYAITDGNKETFHFDSTENWW